MTQRIEVEDLAETVGPTLDAFVDAAKPRLRKCAEAVYEELLYSVQDYLRENAEWNIGGEIERCRKIETENRELRAKLEPLAGIPDPAAYVAAFDGMREALVMAVAEMMRASGRLDVIATCNEDRRIAAALSGTRDFIRAALTAARQARGGE